MLHKCVFLFLILVSGKSFADDCTISLTGSILDKHDNSQLDYATIYLVENGRGAMADSSGSYSLENLCAGNYTCIIEHLGCKPDTQQLSITKSLHLNFYLEHHAQELEEVVALSSRADKLNTAAQLKITGPELENLKGKDLGAIVNTLSGVSLLKTGSSISKPIINGLYGDRVSIINNGVLLESQAWGTEHAPEIDPFAAHEIKVVKGAGSLEYSTQSVGGLIVLDPALLPLNKHIRGGLNMVEQTNGWSSSLSAFLEQGFKKKFAYRIQGTYKRAADLHTPGYVMSNSGQQQGDFSLMTKWNINDWEFRANYSYFGQYLGIMSASHIGNVTDLYNAISSGKPLIIRDATFKIDNPKQKVQHQVAELKINKAFKKAGYIDIKLNVQSNHRREYDIRRGGRSEIPALDMRLNTLDIRTNYTFEKTFSKGWHYETRSGLNYQYQFNYNNPETGIVPLIPDYLNNLTGIFHTSQIDKNNIIIEAGARYEWSRFVAYTFDKNNLVLNYYSFHTYAATAGLKWLNKMADISTNISLARRNPNASELFSRGLHHGLATLEFGDPALKSENSIKWINQFLLHYKKYIETDIAVYINPIQNFIFLQPDSLPVLTIRGAFPAFHYDQSGALLCGLDFSATFLPLKFWKLGLKSSIVRGRNISTKDWLIYMPSDNITASTEFFRDWKKLKYLHFKTEVQTVFKQTRTPSKIKDFKEAPKGYTLWNMETGANISFRNKHELGISIAAENVLNKKYRDYLNRFRYYTDEMGFNFIVRLNYIFG